MPTAPGHIESRELSITFSREDTSEKIAKPLRYRIGTRAQTVAKVAITRLTTLAGATKATDTVISGLDETAKRRVHTQTSTDSLRDHTFDRAAFTKSLTEVSELLNAHGITWCLGSSGALYVQGVAIRPNDLDVVVDNADFDRARHALRPLEPGDKEPFAFAGNTFYRFPIQNTDYSTEIVGFDIAADPLVHQNWAGARISVHPLEFELGMYQQRPGKAHVAALIRATMQADNVS